MIPNSLSEWTFEAVTELAATGQTESDRHDFKFSINEFNPTKATQLCCAFANTYGGFIVIGVKQTDRSGFDPRGIDADSEIYSHLVSKIRAEPQIDVPQPRTIPVPDNHLFIYVFRIPLSPRRPHLPSRAEDRIFWKREGASCKQMTLEEIRGQMLSYEEKREKLTLLLIDLHPKLVSMQVQASLSDGDYNGDMFSFDNVDRIVAESFSLIKDYRTVFDALDGIRRICMLLNTQKQVMLRAVDPTHWVGTWKQPAMEYRDQIARSIATFSMNYSVVSQLLKDKLQIINPYLDRMV